MKSIFESEEEDEMKMLKIQRSEEEIADFVILPWKLRIHKL